MPGRPPAPQHCAPCSAQSWRAPRTQDLFKVRVQPRLRFEAEAHLTDEEEESRQPREPPVASGPSLVPLPPESVFRPLQNTSGRETKSGRSPKPGARERREDAHSRPRACPSGCSRGSLPHAGTGQGGSRVGRFRSAVATPSESAHEAPATSPGRLPCTVSCNPPGTTRPSPARRRRRTRWGSDLLERPGLAAASFPPQPPAGTGDVCLSRAPWKTHQPARSGTPGRRSRPLTKEPRRAGLPGLHPPSRGLEPLWLPPLPAVRPSVSQTPPLPSVPGRH